MRSYYRNRFGLLATLAAFAAAGGTSGSAQAQDYQARSWAASCASCHGTGGRSAGDVPSLAGRSQADLVALLKEFKAKKRKNATVMHQYAVGYSDAQLERIAAQFAQQPR